MSEKLIMDEEVRVLVSELGELGLLRQLFEFAQLSKSLHEKGYTGRVVFHSGNGILKGYDISSSVRWKTK